MYFRLLWRIPEATLCFSFLYFLNIFLVFFLSFFFSFLLYFILVCISFYFILYTLPVSPNGLVSLFLNDGRKVGSCCPSLTVYLFLCFYLHLNSLKAAKWKASLGHYGKGFPISFNISSHKSLEKFHNLLEVQIYPFSHALSQK